jgi:PiT family inorganic phosphate transporter
VDLTLIIILLAVVSVFFFDFTNGFHDTANIIAPIIASRAMTPVQSVLLVAFFEFLGPIFGGTAVANTIGSFVSLDDLKAIDAVTVLISGLMAAVSWNIVTWKWGIPSSSSHALVGGLIGAVFISAGSDHIVWGFQQLLLGEFTGVAKVIIALIFSPLIGFWVGFFLQKLMMFILRAAKPSINHSLKKAQIITAAGLAFSHGANDAQKSMGVLTLILLLGGQITHFSVPFWVVLLCASAITLGVLFGGWRIVRTLGFAIYKLRPIHAFNTQISAISVIFSASLLGAPVSTTHVVSSAIMGIGSAERYKAVKWQKAKEMLQTWVITIPATALLAAILFSGLNLLLLSDLIV